MRVMIAGIIIASSVVTAQACGTSELAGDWTFTPGGSDICALEIQSSGAVSGQCTEFRDRQVEGTYRLILLRHKLIRESGLREVA